MIATRDNSPAAKAGLQTADYIRAIDRLGRDVRTRLGLRPDSTSLQPEAFNLVLPPGQAPPVPIDRIVPLEVGIKLRRTLPNSTLKLVEECGHMPQEEQPESTLDLIQSFLGGPSLSKTER